SPEPRRSLLRASDTCWRVARARRAAFLVDGEVFFTALAAALERARHQVILLGWDFHGRVRLRRDARRRALPDDFLGLLEALLERRPGLEIYVLGWSYGIVRAIARELAPRLHLGLHQHPRLHFRLDADHPLLASHHQKIVAIDDATAFSGGFDVTTSRWDTRAHLPDDRRRVAPGGHRYGPFHDVQMAVDGDAAAALAELARERWQRATGVRLAPPPPSQHDAWPVELVPSARQVEVGISRTEPGRGRAPIREIEALFVATIAAAERTIYAESQYLTSDRIVEALAARLAERSGPEIVVVNPQRSPAWLEEISMGVLRAHAVHRLRRADRHGRLGIFYPRLPSGCLNVHSKVTVVDDRLARVGSANLANRSLALDTECDLSIESQGRADVARAITALRDDLVAEHLGTTEARVREAVRERGSLLAAIAALRGGKRSLEPLRVPEPGLATALVEWTGIADPGRPSAVAERLASRPRRQRRGWVRHALRFAAAAAAAAGLAELAS
ncbi:MAG TPA: phospholipase D-like domain-containing protein, partial [Myxococcota bacterium]|nr:phospholipase D-like domain-containing protein [Myxococcota bacterium]